MDHAANSASYSDPLDLVQYGAKEKYSNFATFNRIVDTKTGIINTEPNLKYGG